MDASDGTVSYMGKDIAAMTGAERRATELAVQMIFQDPMASLNPRMRVVDIIGEAPVVHGIIKKSQLDTYVSAVMLKVGLDPTTRMPLSAPVLRWSARPHRDCPGHGGESEGSGLRRIERLRSTSRSRRRCSTCSWTCAGNST